MLNKQTEIQVTSQKTTRKKKNLKRQRKNEANKKYYAPIKMEREVKKEVGSSPLAAFF